jgi:hypothetical protein
MCEREGVNFINLLVQGPKFTSTQNWVQQMLLYFHQQNCTQLYQCRPEVVLLRLYKCHAGQISVKKPKLKLKFCPSRAVCWPLLLWALLCMPVRSHKTTGAKVVFTILVKSAKCVCVCVRERERARVK